MSRLRMNAVRLAARLVPICLLGPIASAQEEGRSGRPNDEPTPIASTRSGSISTGATPLATSLKAAPRLDGTPAPGLRVTLDGASSAGGRMWYRWLQTQGPAVALENANRAEASFVVPADASVLGFVLVVGNASGVDARTLTVEVEDPERAHDSQALKADAGDDQSAKVGRRVVLNGVRSEPKGKVRFRWVQTSGPKVALKAGDGPTASFIPESPGTYQFGLIVATAAGKLSEVSAVNVTVTGSPRASADAPSMAIDELARVSLASIEGGPRYADDLSKTFDSVADRIDTYKSFSDAIKDMTRRLDSVVPRDKERRSVWVEQMFSPLMAKMVSGMKADGLDLSQPEAQSQALTRPQRARLAEQFRYTAAGLRASKTMR